MTQGSEDEEEARDSSEEEVGDAVIESGRMRTATSTGHVWPAAGGGGGGAWKACPAVVAMVDIQTKSYCIVFAFESL
jgi:hypothetical protein